VGVLQADEPRRCQREIGGTADRLLDIVRRQAAACALDGPRHGAGQHREPAALGIVDVGLLLDDHLAAAAAVGDQRRQVGHRARGQEQRVVLAGHAAGELLELGHGGIVTARGVAQPRRGDRCPHRRRGQGDGVAAEVVHAGRLAGGQDKKIDMFSVQE
jgi:hypothetical protein